MELGTVPQCGCEGGDTGVDGFDGVGECEAMSMLLQKVLLSLFPQDQAGVTV